MIIADATSIETVAQLLTETERRWLVLLANAPIACRRHWHEGQNTIPRLYDWGLLWKREGRHRVTLRGREVLAVRVARDVTKDL